MLNKITSTAADILKGVAGAVASQSNTYNPQQEYRNAEKVSQMYSDAINTQYAAGIQNLMDQKKAIPLQYDPQRASVNTNYERGVRNNAEQMANLGLERSGTNLTQQMALETERQRGLAEVNAAQDEATRNLRAQINEYIAQRDSAIAQQRAGTYENAYNNISAYQRQLAQMEKQHRYDKEMAAISHGYDKDLAAVTHGYDIEMAEITNNYNRQMAVLEYEHSLALANNNHEKQAALQREMAALEQQYKMQTLNRQAEIERSAAAVAQANNLALLEKEYTLKKNSNVSSTSNEKDNTSTNKNNTATYVPAEGNDKSNYKTETRKNTGPYNDPYSDEYVLYTSMANAYYNSLINGQWTASKNDPAKVNAIISELDNAVNSGAITEEDYIYILRKFGMKKE